MVRNSGLFSFSAMNSMWSSVHCSLTDSPWWLGGRKVTMHWPSTGSELCHGAVARGQILSVLSWAQLVMQDMHVEGVFLVFLGFPWWVRCGRGGGGWMLGRMRWRARGALVIMGGSSLRQERGRGSLF